MFRSNKAKNTVRRHRRIFIFSISFYARSHHIVRHHLQPLMCGSICRMASTNPDFNQLWIKYCSKTPDSRIDKEMAMHIDGTFSLIHRRMTSGVHCVQNQDSSTMTKPISRKNTTALPGSYADRL
mmetsp:Transcript_25939/g.38320  ORF Transcript_25939/g.38320 Transcript_25939/m.38320 type:complete len:125 (+) Transcript_25939:586-960(+)